MCVWGGGGGGGGSGGGGGGGTGTRSKIFNEIVLKDNHFLTLHEKCI